MDVHKEPLSSPIEFKFAEVHQVRLCFAGLEQAELILKKIFWRIDPNSGRNTFTYDAAGQRTQVIDPLARRTTIGYDSAGRITLRIDARRNRATYSFDAANQETGRKYPDGTRATFAFDSVGNRTTMRDSTGRYTHTFDQLSRMKTVALPSTQRLTYIWDAIGQRNYLIAPTGGRFTYAYDAAKRVTRVINPEGDRTSYSYDNADRRTVKTLANGTRASFNYDDADQITRLANIKSDGTTISSYTYKYDKVGNRTRVVESNGDRVTWTYDSTYQLLSERRSGTSAYANTFVYDSRGNRTLKNESGSRTTYIYDAANQIRYGEAVGRTTYTFDANGNQQLVVEPTGNRTTTTWDYENQPTLYKLPASARMTIAYNADNQRVQIQSASDTTKFIWDQQNYLAEADGSNTIQTVYTNEPRQYGSLISTRLLTTAYYHQFDALGSTRHLVNSSGAVSDVWIYDAWGNIVSRTGAALLYLQWLGECGYSYDSGLALVHVRRRTYCPQLGLWLSPDPLGHEGGINLYRYCDSDPLNQADPTGLLAPVAKAIAIFVAAEGACILATGGYAFSQQANMGINDATAHCYASCMIARNCGKIPALIAGYANEIVDELYKQFGAQRMGWDPRDVLNNTVGRDMAGWETWIPFCGNVGRWFRQNCLDGCKAKKLQ